MKNKGPTMIWNSECHQVRQWLPLLAESDLPLSERTAVERHLRQCSDCRQEFSLTETSQAVLHEVRATRSSQTGGSLWPAIERQLEGKLADQAGGVAAKLAILAQAGSNLEYIYTHRQEDKPGKGILYVAPISGPMHVRAAKAAGFHETNDPVVIRVEGDDRSGLAHKLTVQWEKARLNLQGLTMASIGGRFVGFVAFDSVADANRAAAILGDIGANSD